jgi:galactofuranosylgalactofuranosylrhamnosyl-N-acetylglucosaminyl-diphospho-decaprenol beta-1,5/1,6-galactofuranosyltransferase
MARSNATSKSAGVTTLQKVVFPMGGDSEQLSLYVDANVWGDIAGKAVRLSDRDHADDVIGRNSFRVRPGRRVSLASYFNAFPASYWHRWTGVREVVLSVVTSGHGSILLYRSNARGVAQRIDSVHVKNTGQLSTFQLPLTNFLDGGWYWFDLVADTTELILDSAEFATSDAPQRQGKATVAITTFNRPDYCLNVLAALGGDRGLRDVIDTVVVVDQGNKLVSDEPGFAQLKRRLGGRLTYITQPNLGGSGGFSRGMIEALKRPESDFVLLLDDDVVVEPEGVSRAVTFGRFTHNPTIVGGHMFDMFNKAELHAFSEKIDLDKFMWGVKYQDQFRHNFTKSNLRQTPWLHERADVDFNGWWMSLIPLEVVRKIGLSLPVFIKWDDAEYSLRARDFGHSTVSFPGAAVWHVSWQDKDDLIDWQAYFHTRNRWIAALLHSPYHRGGKFIRDSFAHSVKRLFMMQYYSGELYLRAIEDVLRGPQDLHAAMPTKLADSRALAIEYPETQVFKDTAHLPAAVLNKEKKIPTTRPERLSLLLWLLRIVPKNFFISHKATTRPNPQVSLSAAQAVWWRLGNFDVAAVSLADGSGKVIYRRDSREFRRQLRRTISLHMRLRRVWPSLSAKYRESLADITSKESWGPTLGL